MTGCAAFHQRARPCSSMLLALFALATGCFLLWIWSHLHAQLGQKPGSAQTGLMPDVIDLAMLPRGRSFMSHMLTTPNDAE